MSLTKQQVRRGNFTGFKSEEGTLKGLSPKREQLLSCSLLGLKGFKSGLKGFKSEEGTT